MQKDETLWWNLIVIWHAQIPTQLVQIDERQESKLNKATKLSREA